MHCVRCAVCGNVISPSSLAQSNMQELVVRVMFILDSQQKLQVHIRTSFTRTAVSFKWQALSLNVCCAVAVGPRRLGLLLVASCLTGWQTTASKECCCRQSRCRQRCCEAPYA